MDIKQLGEFGLIDLLKQDTIVEPASVVVGIGDDAAVYLASPGQQQLVTTDMMVEGVHFSLNTTNAWQLGYKSVAVNISDIAAMGGLPRHAVVSIAIPGHINLEFITGLYQGMKDICREHGVNIIGGDTVSSQGGLVINVALLGEVEPSYLLKRSGAQIGDLVVVTGTLGNSGAGLELLSNGNGAERDFAGSLITSHLSPHPQVKAGRIVAAAGASSADDISDGLASEVNEIAAASRVGMRIYEDKIPLSGDLQQAAGMLTKPAVDYALYGGEDFQLLFTISSERFRPGLAGEAGIQLTVIGEVVSADQGIMLVRHNGTTEQLEPKGYNHFR